MSLGELPDDASPDMARVAADLAFLIGLFASAGENRPLPYSARFCADRMGWRNGHMRASKALRALADAEVVERIGELKRLGVQPRGTLLYAAPVLGGRRDVQREPVVVERPRAPVVVDTHALDPRVELGDHPDVNGADVTLADDSRVIAPRDAALAGTDPATKRSIVERDGHEVYNDRPAIGGSAMDELTRIEAKWGPVESWGARA